jgi:hypothetical protein
MDKREPILNKLALLKKQIGQINQTGLYLEKWKEAEQIISAVVALDKKNNEAMQRMMSSVKASIKEINDGKKLNDVYMNHSEQGYSNFLDTKQ